MKILFFLLLFSVSILLFIAGQISKQDILKAVGGMLLLVICIFALYDGISQTTQVNQVSFANGTIYETYSETPISSTLLDGSLLILSMFGVWAGYSMMPKKKHLDEDD